MSDKVIIPSHFSPSQLQRGERPWYQPGPGRILVVLAIAITIWFLWFLFTAKSVALLLDPEAATTDIHGGFALELGGIHLLRSGDYELEANHPGYFPLIAPLSVGGETNQEYVFKLRKLPGRISFETIPENVTLQIGDTDIGTTPLETVKIPAGSHQIVASNARYQSFVDNIDIIGMDQNQTITLELKPNWADVTFSSSPADAMVSIDSLEIRSTPAEIEVLAGEHKIKIKRRGYKTWTGNISVLALTPQTYPRITLEKADGLVNLASNPAGASITLDGSYLGDTPLEFVIKPGQEHTLDLFKPGFEHFSTKLSVSSGQERNINLQLTALSGELLINVLPADAVLKIDGVVQDKANTRLRLSALAHEIELSKPGFAGYKTSVTPTPGFLQEVKVKLLTVAAARLASLKPSITAFGGYKLRLFSPNRVQMGASRREPGRRSNEILRDVALTRMFYVGIKEVSNAEFRLFAKGHSSGQYEEQELDKSDQPAVRISWQEAALYCNWLSKQEGLPPYYTSEFGAITGSNPRAIGYRLPTEAEWAWLARSGTSDGKTRSDRFAWGRSLVPPDRHGNYADRSAAHLVGRVIFGYNDNHIVTAPVATFPPDERKLYDLSGNVSEWINDFYEIPKAGSTTDPLGPVSGEYHVIRGSSWMHGTVVDLRLSFRDYGIDGRQDLGFRIARFAE